MSFWKWLSGQKSNPLEVKKYLIVGLGNIGATYHNTRHNIGFDALDALAEEKELTFVELRYGALTKTKFKGSTKAPQDPLLCPCGYIPFKCRQ